MSNINPNPLRTPLVAFSLAALASVISTPIVADEFGNPPVAAIKKGDDKRPSQAGGDGDKAMSAENVCSSSNDPKLLCYDLDVRYVTGKIRNPNLATKKDNPDQGYDYVKLRSYCGNTGENGSNNNCDGNTEMEFVAPQVELKPGHTFRLTLNNQLAKAEEMGLPWGECTSSAPTHNDPHCANFNLTNMHTHGLWVSPVGNSDNVLLTISPGVPFTYEYHIPENHPAGTFWYHSHRHGSTAPQVASGMAGTIIIRDQRQPKLLSSSAEGNEWEPGDIDVLLPRPPETKDKIAKTSTEPTGDTAGKPPAPEFPERVMLFQQIAYACRWTDKEIEALAYDKNPLSQYANRSKLYAGKIKTQWKWDKDESGNKKTVESDWFCDTAKQDADLDREESKLGSKTAVGRIGTVEPGPVGAGRGGAFDQLGFGTWPQSKRHTSINGKVHKEFEGAVTGRVERWRLIHGGVRETIKLEVRKVPDNKAAGKTAKELLGAIEKKVKVKEFCPDDSSIKVMGLATDGLTRPALDERSETWLQPGYREDILVSFPEPGIYCIFNAQVSTSDNINAVEKAPAVLGMIDVTGKKTNGDAAERIIDTLIESAKAITDKTAREQVINDLKNDRKLSAFVWHKPIEQEELSGQQTLAFQFDPNPTEPKFDIGTIRQSSARVAPVKNPHGIYFPPEPENARKYTPERIDRLLPLHGTDEWLMTATGAAGHPFHIHVNPFQIVAILKYPDDADIKKGADLTDISSWEDVSEPGSGDEYAGLKGTWKDTIFVKPGYLVQMRTRYERYIGDFVLHCHILDHEDQGMMQNVRIALPDGRGDFDAHDMLIPRPEARAKTNTHEH